MRSPATIIACMNPRIASAVQTFWMTRRKQSDRQGGPDATRLDRDQGARTAVTGGKHLDGFVTLVREMIERMGVAPEHIYVRGKIELSGFFRPEKQWDLVVVDDENLIAAIEFKSQVGPSFGSNFNNRCEEAIGNAFDFWTAWERGVYSACPRPWLGFLMLLEDSELSARTVNVDEPHFPILPEFHQTSYSQRYAILLEKLVDTRMYSSACFLLSKRNEGLRGAYSEPDPQLGFATFASSLNQHIKQYLAGSR